MCNKILVSVEEISAAYVVFTNQDLNEGRGAQYPLFVCRRRSTAERMGRKKYVQGSDCPIELLPIYRIDGRWYGPIRLVYGSAADEEEEKKINARQKARQKALAAGLTSEDIAALTNTNKE